ncbi:MAG: FAD-dependent oxidoreductase, partial [Bauldia sp.]|nr:FAD-dependent oxidoreductase [Bauldia sp.]
MTAVDVLVVGGGPAGVAAASAAARAGLTTMLVDQRSALGGALHVQPAVGVSAIPMPGRQTRRWRRLTDELAALPVETRLRTSFAGLDAAGIT